MRVEMVLWDPGLHSCSSGVLGARVQHSQWTSSTEEWPWAPPSPKESQLLGWHPGVMMRKFSRGGSSAEPGLESVIKVSDLSELTWKAAEAMPHSGPLGGY